MSDLIQAFQVLTETALSEVNTTAPGVLRSYNPERNRAVVAPVLPKRLANGDPLPAPDVVEVPIVWPLTMGGTAGLTLPMRAGDGLKLDFSQRSLEGWLGGSNEAPDDPRRFDLSDAVATPGLQASGISANKEDVELRFGPVKLRLKPDGGAVLETAGGNLTISADGVAAFTGPRVTVSGDVEVQGNITAQGDITAGTVSLKLHRHTASGGTGIGGPPQP